jgi:NTE family protein
MTISVSRRPGSGIGPFLLAMVEVTSCLIRIRRTTGVSRWFASLVIDNQVRALRKRQIIEAFKSSPGEADHRDGVYVGIRSHVADYGLDDAMAADPKITDELAGLPTRLAAISDTQQQKLINWGYTICDTGLRKHVMPQLQRGQLPYPADP